MIERHRYHGKTICEASDVEALEQERNEYKALAERQLDRIEELKQLNAEMLEMLKEVQRDYGDSIILKEIIEKAEAMKG